MITRPSAGQHICLRCQKTLAKGSSSTSRAILQSHSIRRSFSTQGQRLQNEKGTSGSSVGVVRRSFGRHGGSPKPQLSARPLGRLHGHRGHKLRENLEKLTANSLGDPAQVIILRDSIFNLYDHEREKIQDVKPEHIDILGQLDEERGLVDQEEVNVNIDAFKPKEGKEPLNWEGINILVRQLQESFTALQLERYVEKFDGRREPDLSPRQWVASEKGSPILFITPWQPGISPVEEYFDNDPLRGYYMESHTTKQRMILRIVRECWNLELPELKQGIGQFETQIQPEDLEMFLSTLLE
jgi:hypothetical protein